MIVLDVNVLVATFRADHPHHQLVRPWLEDTLRSATPVVVPDLVWVGFVRVSTNLRIFTVPSGLEETLQFVRTMTEHPRYVPLAGLTDGLEPFLQTCADAAAGGNLTTDAYIAAVALAWGGAVATLDRDFRRFDGLRIITPAL